MDFKMRILLSVIKRRIADGEELEAILLTYPKLTASEIEIVKENLK